MIATNYSEFRKDLKQFLDQVEDNNEILVLNRKTGKATVMMSLEEYNSLMETMHLLKSRKNAEHLFTSMDQLKKGKTNKIDLNDL